MALSSPRHDLAVTIVPCHSANLGVLELALFFPPASCVAEEGHADLEAEWGLVTVELCPIPGTPGAKAVHRVVLL